ncbi:pimeloyl-ACP methyl ester carboxylesterase [Providencia alcalifaciens]|nr:pimeloyl-ACP methyl ester carboxylesterase [Providencia alcalifaciens]
MLKPRLFILFIFGFIPFTSQANSIQWRSCSNSKFHSWFNDTHDSRLLCGYLDVPLKYENGTSEKGQTSTKIITLALTRLPATGERKGSLVVITGGPGMSGISHWLDHTPVNELNKSWDIVRYDPRGVGQSFPKINCEMSDEISDDVTRQDHEAQSKLKACVDNTGVDVLQHIGTDEAVSDVDRIRQALNDNKLTAVSYSYGTQVALLYAERFPSTTRALVMDGVVNIDEAKDYYTVWLNYYRGYQKTFERFATWCAETGSCPLSADKVVATQQYRNLLNQLHYQPLVGEQGQQVSAEHLISMTTYHLLWRSSWQSLATTINQLSAGIVSKETIQLLDTSESFAELDALNVINCADQSMQDLSRSELLHKQQRMNEAFTAINYQPYREDDSLSLCSIWPWKNSVHAKRPVNVPNLPQLLFVSQRHDPATSWHNARAMATLFRSPQITLEGDGHTVALTGENLFVDNRVVEYLINPDRKLNDSVCQ